jgi:hypothetical protein
MPRATAEVTTKVVDLTMVSLIELRSSDDPALLRSLQLVTSHTESSRLGVLQNQAPGCSSIDK